MQKISYWIKYAVAAQVLLTGLVLPALADDAQTLTIAYNASGHDLFKRLAAKPGNIVLSPYSIGTAMAMVLSGARGETEAEMIAVLGHRLSRAEIGAANSRVLATLNGYGEGNADADRSPRLRIANALMLTRAGGNAVAPDYIALVKDKFDSEVFRDAGLDEVNGWVRKRTEGRQKLFDRLDPTTALVLLNAVYFKAAWKTKFPKSATEDRDFHPSASETVRVRTMRQEGRFAVAKRLGYRAIRLPYSVESLSMVILLPDAIDGASALATRLDAAEVGSVLAEVATAHPVNVNLAMPRFKAMLKTSLVLEFQQMGMKRPFVSALADFSGITERPLEVGEINHAAMIEVDEEGTAAAAATGVSMLLRSAPMLEDFRVDRPFLFYLTDTRTGAILFQGLIRRSALVILPAGEQHHHAACS